MSIFCNQRLIFFWIITIQLATNEKILSLSSFFLSFLFLKLPIHFRGLSNTSSRGLYPIIILRTLILASTAYKKASSNFISELGILRYWSSSSKMLPSKLRYEEHSIACAAMMIFEQVPVIDAVKHCLEKRKTLALEQNFFRRQICSFAVKNDSLGRKPEMLRW